MSCDAVGEWNKSLYAINLGMKRKKNLKIENS